MQSFNEFVPHCKKNAYFLVLCIQTDCIQQKLRLFSPVKFLTNAPQSMIMKENAFFFDDLNESPLEKEIKD